LGENERNDYGGWLPGSHNS